MHALIVEPQIFTSLMIEDALRDAGYTSVSMATTEEDAIADAESTPPDLVASAVRLAPGSGFAAVEAIRSKCNAAVLFITERIVEVGQRAPGAAVLKKPFLAADLRHAIAKAKLRRG